MARYTTIDATELKQLMDAGEKLTLVETLAPEYFGQGHLPGAINIPTNEIEEEAPTKLDRNETIVVYCANEECSASPQAAKKLAHMGYSKVIDFEAGKEGWRNAGYGLVA